MSNTARWSIHKNTTGNLAVSHRQSQYLPQIALYQMHYISLAERSSVRTALFKWGVERGLAVVGLRV